MKHVIRVFLAAASVLSCLGAASPTSVYSENFDAAAPGKPGTAFLVLAGAFEVKDVDGRRLLELAGEPLESFGVMFGPAEHALVDVRADVWAATTGRRFPEFGVGAADVSGYRLWLIPRQKRLVIRKADVEVASAPYQQWQTDAWTAFRLSIEPAGDGWRVTGTARPAGAGDAKAVTVTFEEKEKPPTGRGSVWGTPFSGRPIRFDNLEVRTTRP